MSKMTSYQKYQLQWMLARGYSLEDLVDELTSRQAEDPEGRAPVSEIFRNWERDSGFGGEIWTCEEEWSLYEGTARDPGPIPTIEETDHRLEKIWAEFGDIPINPETGTTEEDFHGFPAGTSREEIWRWFDECHSRGVAHLFCSSDGTDRTDDVARYCFRRTLCEECSSGLCIFNPEGVCLFPLLYGKAPMLTEEDGCLSSVYDEGIAALKKQTAQGTPEWKVVIVSGGVRYDHMSGFATEAEAEAFADSEGWQYKDEHDFVWDLEVEEDLSSGIRKGVTE